MKDHISGGYILLSRKLIENEIWDKPPLYLKVWIYLLSKAQHRQYKSLKRGQLYTSLKEIAEACSWQIGYRKETPNKDQIYKIIEWLRKPREGGNESNDESNGTATMIATTKATHGILINIENYGFYQDPKSYESNDEDNDENDTKATTKDLRKQQSSNNINKNDKNDKNNKNILCAFFDELWELYPEKKGKTKVTQKALTEIEKIGFEKMVQCIKRYKQDKPEWQNWKNGSTFFNSGYIDYLDENYTEDAPEKTQTIEELWGEFGAK